MSVPSLESTQVIAVVATVTLEVLIALYGATVTLSVPVAVVHPQASTTVILYVPASKPAISIPGDPSRTLGCTLGVPPANGVSVTV